MIKFFRKIRQQLLVENRISKYLIYAIGEIILVVIGILIALYLNKRSELAQEEIKTKIILQEVLEELSTNIKQADYGIQYIFTKHSYFKIVAQDSLTNEYISNNLYELLELTTNYNYGTFSQNGYDNLVRNLNIIPIKYKPVLKKLNKLYGGTTRFVYKYQDFIEQMANDNLHKRASNYNWFSKPDNPALRQDIINFMLNDYHYKNEVELFYRNSYVHNYYLLEYISQSLSVYHDIANLLGVPTINLNSNNKIEAAKKFIGEWKTTTIPDYGNFIFKIIDQRLYSSPASDTTNVKEEYILSAKKLNSKTILTTLNEGEFFTYVLEGDTIFASDRSETFHLVRINDN